MNSRKVFVSIILLLMLVSLVIAELDTSKNGIEIKAANTSTMLNKSNVTTIPGSFPEFVVPGIKNEMDSLRRLFYLHFKKPAQHCTFWDPWVPRSLLWPSAEGDFSSSDIRKMLKKVYLDRHISSDGYVSTQQHLGLAHIDGWPFPLWMQTGGIGWHFSLEKMPYGEGFGMKKTTEIKDWQLMGAQSLGINETGWHIRLNVPKASIITPDFNVQANVAPFIRLEWKYDAYLDLANPYLEWKTKDNAEFSGERRIYFSPVGRDGKTAFSMIPVYKLPLWKGEITGLKFGFDNAIPVDVTIISLITAADSRHNINNAVFLQACDDYFRWTGDLDFLRNNIQRMRLALRYAFDEFSIDKNYYVFTPWQGHDGTSGLATDPNGKRIIRFGKGIGNNYWDLLPFGGKDALATIYYYDAIRRMANIERYIADHPEIDVPQGAYSFNPDQLSQIAEKIKQTSGRMFWNEQTGRFVSAIDTNGEIYDYGFTFVNLEAVYYGFANEQQQQKIMDWIDGKRIVESDTSTGDDIYHWRFAPRATTKRNIDYYSAVWSQPEILKFGQQIQDGGAVLGFSYFDIMSRLKIHGPDDAWSRLKQILAWFDDVESEGGYREYYSKPERGSLQGCGTAGGLGLDCEFYESVLLPQVMLDGFMGFSPKFDGFELHPSLPAGWPQLSINGILFKGIILKITVDATVMVIEMNDLPDSALYVWPAAGDWQVCYFDSNGAGTVEPTIIKSTGAERIVLSKNKSKILKLTRK